MTPEEQDKLTDLAKRQFDIAISFRIAAKENKNRIEILRISQEYCKGIADLYDFLKNQEASYIENGE